MPFISTWSRRTAKISAAKRVPAGSGRISTTSTPSTHGPEATRSGAAGENDKYQYVEDILNAQDYYQALGVPKDASAENIRRAYIRRSRVCHPDKFVPPYPRATESFQLLSLAYETLSNSSSKLMYDLSSRQTSPGGGHVGDENPNETLQRVLHQLFIEMMDGQFQTMRAFIHALNETNPSMRISDDAVVQIELAFRKMRELLLCKVIQFELMRLYELQQDLRRLSYFDIWRRMQLSITICKILLQLPIMINAASREKRQRQLKDKDHDSGILGARVENALKLAVGLLEAGERYTTW
ncbi:DnaJ domain-containing protein [Dichotomocladium elegans]|nr:DnaJ domain-containing protein [Dichotomocladium elegans]